MTNPENLSNLEGAVEKKGKIQRLIELDKEMIEKHGRGKIAEMSTAMAIAKVFGRQETRELIGQ